MVRGSLEDTALDAEALELVCRALAGEVDTPGREEDTPGATAERSAWTHVVEAAGRRYVLYVEVHRSRDELLILGAGHIAVPLARLGAMIGFRVVVLATAASSRARSVSQCGRRAARGLLGPVPRDRDRRPQPRRPRHPCAPV